MFTTVRLGKTTLSELAASFSVVAPIANASGISLEQVSAAMATLTKQGTPTAQAATQLRAAMFSANEVLGDGWTKTMTLQQAMQKLSDKVGGSQAALKDLVGRKEAVMGVLQLTGESAAMAASDLDEMTNSLGAADAAFGKMDESMELDKKMQALNNTWLEFASVVLPAVVTILDKAVKLMDAMGGAAARAADELKRTMGNLGGTEQGSKDKFGVGSRALGKIRRAIQNGDTESLEALRRLYPEAVAQAEKHLSLVEEVAQEEVAIAKEATDKKIELTDKETKAAEKAAREKERLEKRLARTRDQLAQMDRDRAERLARAEIAAFRKNIAEQKRIGDMIAGERLQELNEQEAREGMKADDKKLLDKLRRKSMVKGLTMSKKDQQMLKVLEDIEANAQWAQQDAENAMLREKMLAENQLKEMQRQRKALENIEKQQAQLLAMG